jgi:Leucine-rich repeat (LRR) protein
MPMNPRLLRPLARAPAGDPFATLVSTKSTGDVSGIAKSDTGYIKVEWWDSTTNVYGTGVAGNNITWSKAAGGAGSKTLLIYPSDASGNLSGSLTQLLCGNNSLTSLNVSGLTALTNLVCPSNSLASLNVSGLTALTTLNCSANSLTSLNVSGLKTLTNLSCSSNSLASLNVSGCTALSILDCSSNSLTSLNVSGLTALTQLNCYINSLAALDVSGLTALTILLCSSNSLAALDVSGLTALTTLNCSANSLTSLNVSGLTALNGLNCSSNSLTSLRAVGVVFDSGKWKNKKKGKSAGEQAIYSNQLNAAALNQFYTDLGATTPGTGFLDVSSNPGTTTDDPTIATNKGYVVIGS